MLYTMFFEMVASLVVAAPCRSTRANQSQLAEADGSRSTATAPSQEQLGWACPNSSSQRTNAN